MSQNSTKSSDGAKPVGGASGRGTRYAVIALMAVVLFAVSYGVASARNGSPLTGAPAGSNVALAQGSASGASGSGSTGAAGGAPACACCGGSAASSTPIEGTAALEGGVQRISVDLSTGSYNPNTIILKTGVPAEITFGQSSGCTAQVISSDLGFSEDLTRGPRTVKLSALSPGEYQFSCGMQMVFGKIVVQ